MKLTSLRYVLFLLLLFSSVLNAATIGDVISNRAMVTYTIHSIDKNSSSDEVNLTVEGTDATIEFLSADSHGEQTHILGASSYLGNDGVWHTMTDPVLSDGTVLSTTSPIGMSDTSAYNINDISLIKVTDPDQNIDNSVRDIIEVTVTSPSGDSELIRLIETTPDSGIFTGYLILTSANSSHGDGRLHVEVDEHIGVSYDDQGVATRADSAIIAQQNDLKVWIEKQVNKEVATIGEILLYTLTIHNDEAFNIDNLVVDDHLPLGIKYKEYSAKLEGNQLTPLLSEDGKHLYLKLGRLNANSYVKVTFIAEIGAGVQDHSIINEAWVTLGNTFKSNRATVSTRIEEELMRSKGLILGQVYECRYENRKKGHGVANVRLYMENGTYVVTDKNGKYHIEGVEAGTHVVQVDVDLLPDGYMIGHNAKNARFAGRDFSQFVDVGRGALKRVDFCLKRTSKVKQDSNATKVETKVADIYDYKIPTKYRDMPRYNKGYLKHLQGKTDILWPPENYVPSIPSTKIAIVHDKEQKAEVWLNDEKVSMYNYDGRQSDLNNSTVIDTYKGVDLLDQTNTITVKILDKQNRVLKILTRTIHVSNVPVKIEYIEKNSFAVADGKHSPVIAVRFIDAQGQPLRTGITGTFTIDAPYQSQAAIDQLQEDPLRSRQADNRYTIDSDGIAYIKLQPTTQSGTASLHFNIQNRDEVIRAWLKPQLREWIMVGFAEGTVGYNTLSGHKESLDLKHTKDKVITEGRVSFFAKGRIKGEWLLTMAYDSGKDTKNSRFFDEIDPNTYYTLYNDGSVQNYEASSRKKLFLKIEKERFSALFGDFNTDMTYTKLSQYSRQMTGIKSEYHGETLEATAFVSYTDKIFARDEIRGDGTSGFYHLKNKTIIQNSETVTIEVRDRYHTERVIETKRLQRFKDYEIDYNRGTLYFKEPVFSNDENFNPRYIVVNYEIDGDGSNHYTYGGRAAVKMMQGKVEVAGSYIHEDTAKKKSELYGADTTVKIGTHTVIKAEYAKTKTTQDGNTTYGDAKLAEVEYVDNGLYARAYYREQEDSFGLGQLSTSLGATRKMGVDVTKTFDNRLVLKALAYRDTDLLNDKDQDVFEFRAQMNQTLWSFYTGYRFADHTDSEAVHQLLFGASYSFFDQRVKLSATHDHSFGKDEDKLYPTKTTVGLDVALTSSISLFANYEWAKGVEERELGRLGLRYRPWSGMILENTTVSEYTNDITRLYNTLGALQTYDLNKNWSFTIGYEHGELLDGNATKEDDTFDTYKLGVNYHNATWTALINGEYRDGQNEKKYNLTTGVYTQANEALALALSGGYIKSENDLSEQIDANIRFSLAYRPEQTDWIVLDKLDYVYSESNEIDNRTKTEKVINNLNFNYKPSVDFEISVQHGIKYVVDTVEAYEHTGITQLFGLDTHYDITKKWMIGMQGSILYAQSADNWDYGFGLYGSYNMFTNMLLTLGYNWEGFEDRDFSLQTYRIEGPYVQFRMKFDQKNLKDIVRLMSW